MYCLCPHGTYCETGQVPLYPGTHEQPWTWTLTVGLISTEVTRRAVLDPPSDAQTASQARPARAVGRSLAGPGWWTSRPRKKLLPASQHTTQWNLDWCSVLPSVKRGESEREGGSKQASPGEPSERPDRPDDIRPWMQLNHRAHPPTPDPCRLPFLSGTLQVPSRPGIQGHRPSLGPMGPSQGTGDVVPGPARPPPVRAPSTKHHSQRQDRDLEATLGGPLRLAHPRPPTPTHTALLGRRAAQVGFAELSHCLPGLLD